MEPCGGLKVEDVPPLESSGCGGLTDWGGREMNVNELGRRHTREALNKVCLVG